MTQITDEMLMQSFHTSAIAGLAMCLLCFSLGVLLTIIFVVLIKRSKERDRQAAENTSEMQDDFETVKSNEMEAVNASDEMSASEKNIENKSNGNFGESFAIFILFFVIVACIGGTLAGSTTFSSNYNAEKKGYDVELETIVGKVESKKHRQRKRNDNRLVFLTLGEKKVRDRDYYHYQEGDIVYVVVNRAGKVLGIMDTQEYEYIGEH